MVIAFAHTEKRIAYRQPQPLPGTIQVLMHLDKRAAIATVDV
jgi:hypothetical protein